VSLPPSSRRDAWRFLRLSVLTNDVITLGITDLAKDSKATVHIGKEAMS